MKKKIINILEQHSVYRRVESDVFEDVAEQIVSEIKTYTEEDLRLAFRAGITRGEFLERNEFAPFYTPLDEDEYIESLNPQPKEEKDIPVTFFQIKNNIGWYEWCNVTGGNHYALNEGYSPSDNEVFYCTRSQAIKLGIIKE